MIRRQKADVAISKLQFSKKRISKDVEKALKSVISNAENNHSLDIDKLYVKEAFVGKGIVMKRFHARARGRGARILKPFSHLTIILSEETEEKMGQKTKPLGFRLGVNRTWDSRWFGTKLYADQLHQDLKLRKYLFAKLKAAAVK